MADYNISANITADTKGFESGVKKAQTASKNLGKSISNVVKGFGKGGLTGAITSAGLALGGIGLAVGTAVKAIKGITKALGECAEAYKVQLNAERALDTAIRNSPFVSGSASKALKDYASELQKVSNLGDEEIIPQMTQLIATGRTEAEVMKIIATASDMSASGAVSFDQAVTQLNATLNGNIGRLGQQNAELKGLTEEELKSGRAVDILAEKYKGLASATIDTKKQLQNAIGDLKETFGSVFENAMAPMRKFFTDLIQGWADARKAKQEYENSMIAIEKGEATANDYRVKEKKLLEEIEAIEGDLRQQAEELGMTYEEAYNTMADWQRAQLEAMKEELENTQLLARMHEGLEKIKQKEAEWAQEEAEKRQAEIDKETKIADLKTEYLQKIAEQEAKWEHIKEVTGEQIGNEEKIAFYQDSLVDLMTKAGGQITTNNQLYKDQMAIIEELAKKQKGELVDISSWNDKLLAQEIARLEARRDSEISAGILDEIDIRNYYNEQIVKLKEQQIERELEVALKGVEGTENEEEAKLKIIEYYNKKKLQNAMEYAKQKKKVDDKSNKTEVKAWKDKFKEMANVTKNAVSKISGYMSKITKTFISAFKSLNKIDLNDALDTLLKFEDGILTFFVETLPKLPQFLKSAFQSVKVLIASIDFMKVADDFMEVVWTIASEIPSLISSISTIVAELLPKVISGAIDLAAWLLSEGFPALLEGLTNIITSLIRKLPDILEDGIPKLLKGVLDFIPSFFENAGEIISTIVEELPSIITGMINGLVDFLENLSAEDIAKIIQSIITMVGDIASAIIKSIGKIVAELIPALIRLIIELIKSIPDILKGLVTGAFEGITDIGKSIGSALKDLGGDVLGGVKSAGKAVGGFVKDLFTGKLFASGTDNAPKGLAIVGEAGPELVNFRGGEQVLSNSNTKKVLANGVGGSTFNVAFYNTQDTSAYALVSQLKAYNREMAINGVI